MSDKLEEEKAAAAAANNGAQQDDDESDDDDYVPDEEMDDEDDNNDASTTQITGNHLSASKRKAVDDAFERLFGYPFGTRFTPKRRKTSQSTAVSSKREGILSTIFGPSVAAHLLATSNSVRAFETSHVSLPLTVEQTVTEVKRFAGRNIVMEKKVTVASANTSAGASDSSNLPATKTQAATAPTKTSGLDSVLAEIAGPSRLSTVAKTSADWDSYKTKTGVEEELEKKAQSNQAFLVKQDFLKRVDERRFEHERAQRDQERAARK